MTPIASSTVALGVSVTGRDLCQGAPAVIDATVRRLRATGLAVAGFATLRARAVFRAGRMGDPGLRERSGVDVAGMRAGLYAEPVA